MHSLVGLARLAQFRQASWPPATVEPFNVYTSLQATFGNVLVARAAM